VCDCGEGSRRGSADGDEAFGRSEKFVAVRHPYLEVSRERGEESIDVRPRGVFVFGEHGMTVFP
jgi:hypothetical protein